MTRPACCANPPVMPTESRLAHETSPYLLQHAHNPVDWFPWGIEAHDKAKTEDKPILLSIGYSACHWCHVMERESFANESIAAQMNQSFVCIKVDREERPDLDELYMTATVALSGQGGWPMTVFLTPSGEPFFAGTYFPPTNVSGRPSFPSLLARISEMWKTDRKTLLDQAQSLTEQVRATQLLEPKAGVSESALRAACRSLSQSFDEAFGGFGGAPKFPAPGALRLLFRTHRRTGEPELLHMATRTLDGMLEGGMFDQLGGGFCRYSVDRSWLVPHFEKMLYDNAQLADVYIEGFQVTGSATYRRVARQTLDYVLREMQSPRGGFFSSVDADSEGIEGKYYVFSRAEATRAIGEPAATHFCAFYGITDDGNFEGKNVLTARRSIKEVAKEFGIDPGLLIENLELGREKLLAYRQTRVAPDVDDKVLTAWNGLMIRALAHGGRTFGEDRYLASATRAADFLLAPAHLGEGMRRPDGGLYRTSRAGRAHQPAFLEDYFFLIDGLLALYEACGTERYLTEAITLTERALSGFSASDGSFYSTEDGREQLIARPHSGSDSALPSANAVACSVLTRLSVYADRPEWRARALQIPSAFGTKIKRAPRAYCGLLCAVDALLEQPLEIVLAGDASDEQFSEMAMTLGGRFLPGRVEVRLTAAPETATPLTHQRFSAGKPALTYLCQDFTCKRPAETAAELAALLDESEASLLETRHRELGGQKFEGRATPSATGKLRDRSPHKGAFTELDGLWVSRVGLGSHRIGLDHPDHRAAVGLALDSGINFIDTSPSFAFGDSERLLGEVLAEKFDSDRLARDQVVLISKVGVFVGPEAEDLERRRKTAPIPFSCPLDPKAAAQGEQSLRAGAFCLDPELLERQISASLERLKCTHLDVCLIQSPEHYLAAGKSLEELAQALRAAIQHLEAEVSRGRIGRYGVFSNTVCREKSDPLALDITVLVGLAQELNGDAHHFKVLELPINVAESAALSTSGAARISEKARSLGVSLLACRPLSPIVDNALLRLVDPPPPEEGTGGDALRKARYRVASLEAEFETTFAAQLRLAKKLGEGPVLPLSGALGQALEHVATREQFELAETTMITPRLRHLLGQLDRAFDGDQKWSKFREKYVHAVGTWLATVREASTEKNRVLLAELEQRLQTSAEFGALFQTGFAPQTWIERALRPLCESQTITSVLVGLRNPDHVRDVLQVLAAVDRAGASVR